MTTTTEKQKICEQLAAHCKKIQGVHMRDLFMHDKERAEKFSCQFSELHIDYSKNIVSSEILDSLFQFAKASNIEAAIKAMFLGEKINNNKLFKME